MSRSAMIRARIEPELKKQAEEVLKSLGLTASEAMSLFYSQIRYKQGIPFEIKIPATTSYSKISKTSTNALLKKAKRMSSRQRLEAFFNHSYLVNRMSKVSSGKRQTEGE